MVHALSISRGPPPAPEVSDCEYEFLFIFVLVLLYCGGVEEIGEKNQPPQVVNQKRQTEKALYLRKKNLKI